MGRARTDLVACLIVAVVVMVATSASSISATSSPRLQTGEVNPEGQETSLLTRLTRSNRIRPIASKLLHPQNSEDSGNAQVIHFLTKYGYFRKGKPQGMRLPSPAASDSGKEDDFTSAVRMFQSYFGLRQTGKLDTNTLNLMTKSRCGVADIPEDEEEEGEEGARGRQQSPSQYALLGSKWEKNRLTWRLDTTSTYQLSAFQQRRTIQEAIDTWRRVMPLDFEERRDMRDKVDIDIKFGSRHHGDDYPFDGRGKVLAHAFGPGRGDIDGDMHFDNDETWGLAGKEDSTSDLLLVATHELGHSLGLSHSRDPGALMYPYYGLTDRLGADDIKAIQSLYGIRIGQPRTTPEPRTRQPPTRAPRPSTRAPITRAPVTRRPTRTDRPLPITTTTRPVKECNVRFDVVIKDTTEDNVFTGIQGEQIYRFSPEGLLSGYPSHLHTVYQGAPVNAEAVFTVPENSATYFVKEKKVWRYVQSQLDRDYPKDLNPTHFPEVIRFVLPIVDSAGYRRIFVFGRTWWWEYNFDQLPTASHYRPRPNLIPQYWPAVASDVQYAVMGSDNYLYFISPDSHVMLDSFRRALNGGKQEGYPAWMRPACQGKPSSSGTTHVINVAMTCAVVALTILFRED